MTRGPVGALVESPLQLICTIEAHAAGNHHLFVKGADGQRMRARLDEKVAGDRQAGR